LVAVGLLVALSGSGADEPAGPRLRFESETHDFGDLRSDQKVTYEWVYHNDGDQPLEILSTRPSCGCTAVLPDDTPVPPGERGVMVVTFDGAGMRGTIRKSLAVLSNDEVRPRALLTITANVTPVAEPVDESGHPRIAGQSMLVGECASCHAAPAKGKTGTELYVAICAMCHGSDGVGGRAPSIREASYLSSRSDDELHTAIAYGTANPNMPGFLDLMGGPLSSKQVDSLVRVLRSWDRPAATPSHDPGSAGGR
jgi:mono/diheme cytochrome c family protein